MALRTVTFSINGQDGPIYRTITVNSVDLQSDEETEKALKRLILEELADYLELLEMTGPKGVEVFPLTVEQEERFRK